MARAQGSRPVWAAGKTAAVVLVWLVLSLIWIGVLALLGSLIHPAIAPLWFVSAVVLALAVAWWMVRARREPRAVAVLACWWFVASIFGPAALIVTLPWFRGFRHRSLGWIPTAVSGDAASRESRRASSAGGAVRHGVALATVLIGHFLLGFVWLVVLVGAVFLTSSETRWVDLVLLLGALCWLAALALIGIGWRSGAHWYWGVPVAWVIVFAIAAFVVMAEAVKSAGEPSGPPRPGTACPQRSPRARSGQPHVASSQGVSLIAFTSDRDGNTQIYVMNADGSDQRRLTRNATGSRSPAWSPDGTKIAFYRPCSYGSGRHDSAHEIFVMNADGSGQRNLTGTRRSSEESPAWSPDGTRIAFVRPVYSRDSGSGFGIFVMNAGGSGQRVLARNASVFGHPTWSPNGKQIAFAGIDLRSTS